MAIPKLENDFRLASGYREVYARNGQAAFPISNLDNVAIFFANVTAFSTLDPP